MDNKYTYVIEYENHTKNDFEDFSTLTKELSKSNIRKKALIITLIIIVVFACAYLILKNFIIK